jgi:hypothetical protein
MYGPCKTCIAWFVTEPELLAIGFAVALTPPTPSASTLRGIKPLSMRPAATTG